MFSIAAGALCVGALGWSSAVRAEETGAPAASAAEAATSDDCFNAGFYKKGSTIDYVMRVSGDGATPPRRIVTKAEGKEMFNGVVTMETIARFYGDDGSFVAKTSNYTSIADGALLFHGQKGAGWQQTIEPAVRQPISMKVDESFGQRYTARTVYDNGRKEKTEERQRYTYEGLENVSSPVGKFTACRFRTKTVSKVGSVTSTVYRTDWVVSAGKYRGFTIRTKIAGRYAPGVSVNQIIDVTKINAFEIK